MTAAYLVRLEFRSLYVEYFGKTSTVQPAVFHRSKERVLFRLSADRIFYSLSDEPDSVVALFDTG